MRSLLLVVENNTHSINTSGVLIYLLYVPINALRSTEIAMVRGYSAAFDIHGNAILGALL